MPRQEELEHILLHLQDAHRHLDIQDYKQVGFNLYEIGEHLGFSPAEINEDNTKHILMR